MGSVINKFFNSIVFWKLPYNIRLLLFKKIRKKQFTRNQRLRVEKNEINNSSLIKFDEYKCIYVHIPKAGGVSLNKTLFDSLGGGHRRIKDYALIYNKNEFFDYYKFTIVRNPYDRLVSAYYFLKKGGMNKVDNQWYKENISHYKDLNDFICNWVSPKNIYRFIHFIPQYEFVTINGKLMVDEIFKLENIDKHFGNILKKLKLTQKNLLELNKNKNNKEYLSQLNEKSIEIIKNTYYEDFQIFNYSMYK